VLLGGKTLAELNASAMQDAASAAAPVDGDAADVAEPAG
jgi:hypothetical protein